MLGYSLVFYYGRVGVPLIHSVIYLGTKTMIVRTLALITGFPVSLFGEKDGIITITLILHK